MKFQQPPTVTLKRKWTKRREVVKSPSPLRK
jgi:hypothetical protein